MAKYIGGGQQLGECMRSGVKCLASELVRDGRNPNLLVLPRYADSASPQEQPYQPDNAEGRARFKIAPDHSDDTPPLLTASLPDVTLNWTQASTIGPRVESYKAYRATGSVGAFVLLTTLPVVFGSAPRYVETHTLTYRDSSTIHSTQYRYRVDAVTEDSRVISSNVVTRTTV